MSFRQFLSSQDIEFIVCGLGYLIQVVGVLISVAFYTLYERKLLRYSQNRVGPNKVRILGLLQPISDAVKLFTKERVMPIKRVKTVFIFSPIFTLSFPMFMWLLQPVWFSSIEYHYTWLLIFCGCAFNVYFGFLSGWVSNSKYSILGSFRAVSQMISYEVALAFIVIIYVIFMNRYILTGLDYYRLFFVLYPVGILWFIICLRERQRTPFDLAEGESELVSGFNTEFSASYFALLFLGEYMAILFMCMLTVVLMFNLKLCSILFVFVLFVFFTLYLWCRCTYPRVRYDCLMAYLWKGILPSLMLVLSLIYILRIFYNLQDAW